MIEMLGVRTDLMLAVNSCLARAEMYIPLASLVQRFDLVVAMTTAEDFRSTATSLLSGREVRDICWLASVVTKSQSRKVYHDPISGCRGRLTDGVCGAINSPEFRRVYQGAMGEVWTSSRRCKGQD